MTSHTPTINWQRAWAIAAVTALSLNAGTASGQSVDLNALAQKLQEGAGRVASPSPAPHDPENDPMHTSNTEAAPMLLTAPDDERAASSQPDWRFPESASETRLYAQSKLDTIENRDARRARNLTSLCQLLTTINARYGGDPLSGGPCKGFDPLNLNGKE